MRIVAIAIMVLAGAVMVAGGSIADGIQNYSKAGEFALGTGGFVVVIGSLLFLYEYFFRSPN